MIETIMERVKWHEWEWYKRRRRYRLSNEKPVIIASNCVGTLIYHDLKLPFYSPTINLFICMDDFVRFLGRLEWYLEQPVVQVYEDGIPYPIGMLADIKIYFMHYNTFAEAVKAWERRKTRVTPENLFIFGCERDRCTYETIKQFDKLPYKHKVIFTHKDYPEISSAFHIRGFEEQKELRNVLEFRKDSFWKRRYIDDFDYVYFLNGWEKPMISVIVPVYEMASYLETCVQSVLKQTYSSFELILVDDGSEDGSVEIARRLCAGEERIRLLTQEHKGVSAARNAGIRAAKGKYLFFLDSDDAIHPNLLERLCKQAEESGAGVCACRACSVMSKDFEKTRKRLDEKRYGSIRRRIACLKGREALSSLIFEKESGAWSAVCGKLIRRYEVENIWFDENLTNGEDTKFMYQLLEKGMDAAMVKYSGYYYRKRDGSASQLQNMEAYKSIYKCDCYIRDNEMGHGREAHAVRRERTIIGKLSGWHVAGHMEEGHMPCHRELGKYSAELMQAERASELWKRLGIRIKLEYALAFYLYPAYEICHILRQAFRRMKIL